MTFGERLDTGDNPPLHGDLLDEISEYLEKLGHRRIRELRDQRGPFGLLFMSTDGIGFGVVAKGSRLYGQTVSCQNYLVIQLSHDNRPLVLAWKDITWNPPLRFYVFDPSDLKNHNYGTNMRFGVAMLNFNIRQGVRWLPSQPLEPVWNKLKPKPAVAISPFFKIEEVR